MSDVAIIAESSPLAVRASIPAMSAEAIEKVRQVEARVLAMPQVAIFTGHVLHAGLYSRTIMIPAGTVLTGALIKIPTLLIVEGNAMVYIGEGGIEVCGYNVVPASGGRKQVFYAMTDTWVTMVFACSAPDVGAAERQFTDEFELLGSHRDPALNSTVITGE
jgi:hypothetical protein